MLSIICGLLPTLLFASFSSCMCCLSVLVPLSVISMYKTSSVVEDMMFSYSPMSSFMVLLSVSLTMLVMLASKEAYNGFYIFLQISLLALLALCFSVSNLLGFYVLFEACLLPILLMIITWGYQPERLQAGTYLVMYTVLSSLPLLVLLLLMGDMFCSFHLLSLMKFSSGFGPWYLLGFLAFLTKLPIYGFHIWLPKAHVEAPLGGSMMLAGILLKLGGYGMFVWNNVVSPINNYPLLVMIMVLSLWGGVLACISCMMQSDVKSLIAYSSIVHMSVVPMLLLLGTSWGETAGLIILVAHGWTSSALFLMSYITYSISGSRSFSYTKGLLVHSATLSLLWFVFAALNMGFPPSLNFLGEVFAVPSSLFLSWQVTITLLVIMFLSATYNMYLYTQINHGAVTSYGVSATPASARVLLASVCHTMPLVLLGKMGLFSF